jgi:hypothetical protein
MKKGMFLFGGSGPGFLFVRRKIEIIIADAYAEILERTLKFTFETERTLKFTIEKVSDLSFTFEVLKSLKFTQQIEKTLKFTFEIVKKLYLKYIN